MKHLRRVESLLFPVAIAAGVGAVGCSDDDETLSRAEAEQAVVAVNDTVQSGLPTLSQAEEEDRATGVTVRCAGGGSAFFSGAFDVSTVPVIVDVDAEVAFDDCTAANGLVLDGVVEATEHVEVGTAELVQVQTQLNGTVTVSGPVEGVCDLNLSIEVDLTPEGGFADLVTVDGSACGRGDVEPEVQVEPVWNLE